MEEARTLYDSMPDIGQHPEGAVVRARALAHLIGAYAKAGMRDGALYDALAELKDDPEVQKDKRLKYTIKFIMRVMK